MFSLKKEEVNVGRQKELDLVKGFLMIMIILIHSFQTIGNLDTVNSYAHEILFALFMCLRWDLEVFLQDIRNLRIW